MARHAGPGRNSQGRATVNWLPIAAGLTPHGLRHSHKSLMGELGLQAHVYKQANREALGGRNQDRLPNVSHRVIDGWCRRIAGVLR